MQRNNITAYGCTCTLIVCVEDSSFAALDVEAHGGQLHYNSLVQLNYMYTHHMTKNFMRLI